MDKVALGQVFLPSASFSPVSIIPPLLRTHLCLHVAQTKNIKGRLPTSNVLSEKSEYGIKSTFTICMYCYKFYGGGGCSLFILDPPF